MERALPDRHWSQVYILRGDAELARGNAISALRWWEQAYLAADDDGEKREARQHMADAVARMDPATVERARAVLTTPEMRELIDRRAGPGGGAPAPVRSTAARPATGGAVPAPPPRPGDAAPPPLPEGPGVADPRIGVLLPLSGEFASYGQRSLNGVKLALGPQEQRLLVRDTRGDVAAARAALDELLADPNVIAVIGPLRSKEAESLAPRAERAGMPMILLAQQEGPGGRWLVQPAMTAERQGAALAEYGIGQGLRRFGILYPNDPYGSALSQAFRGQVERRGGTVVGSVLYQPGQKEFSVELLSVDKWTKGDALQAVFIPDSAATAVPLATQLRRAHPGLVLLGSNTWNDPAALAPASADLDGAVFVDGFFASSQRPATQDFVIAYRSAYGSAPEIFEAQAYDAAAMVARALQQGAANRAQMAAALQQPRTIEGAAGTMALGPQGVQRQLFLLRLSNGTISEISAAAGPRAVPPAAAPPLPPGPLSAR
jgi:ABC-type branched-subunit amino acid transport system substrate-binding protein